MGLARPAYRLDATAEAIAQALGADPGEDPWAGGIVRPGDFAPVVVRTPTRRVIVPRQWGVPPPPRGVHPVTHLRNPESPFWIGTLRHIEFRCLVPASVIATRAGWMPAGTAPIAALAGVWRDSEVPSFAIVSVGTSDRSSVPLALSGAQAVVWLSAEWKHAQALLAPR